MLLYVQSCPDNERICLVGLCVDELGVVTWIFIWAYLRNDNAAVL